mgnify:CR=1 FL=1
MRDDPDHDAEVRCVIGVMLATQILDVARSQDPSSLKCLEAAVDDFREARVIAQPEPERHAESVFGLGDGFRAQERPSARA